MDTVVTLQDVKNRLGELLERAAQGERVIIRQPGKPSLALVRLEALAEDGATPLHGSETMQQRLEHAATKVGKRFRLTQKQQRQLEELGQKNSSLTEAERAELSQLLHHLEELSRQRAQALGALL